MIQETPKSENKRSGRQAVNYRTAAARRQQSPVPRRVFLLFEFTQNLGFLCHPTQLMERLHQSATMGSEPPNFSWVLPGRLVGLALPRIPAHYQFLWAQGVRHLVSLTERGPPHSDTCPGLTVHRLRIPDFCPPAPEQIDLFTSLVDEANARGEAVGVHCALGYGRTGTMLACYLVKEKGLTGGEAVTEIRRLRPGSIETHEQEKAVFQFYQRTK